jgi:hypothetical protein
MRRKNLDALAGIQCKKVGVTGNNVRRVAAHSQFEELVVPWIAAGRNLHINFNPFRLARQSRQKASNIILIYISKEFFRPRTS